MCLFNAHCTYAMVVYGVYSSASRIVAAANVLDSSYHDGDDNDNGAQHDEYKWRGCSMTVRIRARDKTGLIDKHLRGFIVRWILFGISS
ncbi:hypothetical protein ZHAS_00013416 [Anopheles sinensis]|uniref:Uncharacterized protein n=1 Tax=Anopheles sinensis TaxID=74873 RepID=A0A084W5J0_ANOSI|nr:hypothetical protein ZHAS_00013416 [Anopheles sinensis]